jgi:hypothetical protein
MLRPFEPLQQFFDFGEWWQAKIDWLHLKWLPRRRPRTKSQAQHAINYLLEWLARFANFLLQQAGNIIIDGKSGTHIMMLLL